MDAPKKVGVDPASGADYSALERRVSENMSRHARHYRVGPDAFIRGAKSRTVVHDEIIYDLVPEHELIDISAGLSDIEKRWAAALRKVYKVNAEFFERKPEKKRIQIMKQLTELAKTGRGQAGHKAGEVISVVAEYTLEGKTPGTRLYFDFEFGTLVDVKTGRTHDDHLDQVDAYRYMFKQMKGKEK